MADAKLESLKRRIQKLEERILRQKVGPEVETSKQLLVGLKRRYNDLEKNSSIFVPEASTDDPFPKAASFEDTSWNRSEITYGISTGAKFQKAVSEEQLIEKLGAIYWIFGPSYEEIFSYKKYRIDFLEILPTDPYWQGKMIMAVKVNIYENDRPFVTDEAEIRFWKGFSDSVEVDDLEFSTKGTTKYNNCFWFEKISYNLAKTWNSYFRNIPLITAKESGLLECHSKNWRY